MKTYRRSRGLASTHSYLEAIGQPHVLTVLLMAEAPVMPIEYKTAGWAPESAWTSWKRENSLVPAGYEQRMVRALHYLLYWLCYPGSSVKPVYNHVHCFTVMKILFLDDMRGFAIEAASTHVHSALTMSY